MSIFPDGDQPVDSETSPFSRQIHKELPAEKPFVYHTRAHIPRPAIQAVMRGHRQSYYYRFGAVIHNLVSLVLLVHDPDQSTVRVLTLLKDPPLGRSGIMKPLQSDLIRSELE